MCQLFVLRLGAPNIVTHLFGGGSGRLYVVCDEFGKPHARELKRQGSSWNEKAAKDNVPSSWQEPLPWGQLWSPWAS